MFNKKKQKSGLRSNSFDASTKTSPPLTQLPTAPNSAKNNGSTIPRGGPALLPRRVRPVVPVHPPAALPRGSPKLHLPHLDPLQYAIPLVHPRLVLPAPRPAALPRALRSRLLLVFSCPRGCLPLVIVVVKESWFLLRLGNPPPSGRRDRLSDPASIPRSRLRKK